MQNQALTNLTEMANLSKKIFVGLCCISPNLQHPFLPLLMNEEAMKQDDVVDSIPEKNAIPSDLPFCSGGSQTFNILEGRLHSLLHL
jgi:hypothetical protein